MTMHRGIAVLLSVGLLAATTVVSAGSMPTPDQISMMARLSRVHGAPGGTIEVGQLDFMGTQLVFVSALFDTFPSSVDGQPLGCQLMKPTHAMTAPAWLDVGSTMTIFTADSNFPLTRMMSANGIIYSGLSQPNKPLDVNAFYNVHFAGDGWIPAQDWQEALYMPNLIYTEPALGPGVVVKRGQDFTLRWQPTGGNFFIASMIDGNKIVGSCTGVEASGVMTIPASFVNAMGNSGSIVVSDGTVHPHELLGHKVDLIGTSIIYGNYIVE